MSQLRSCYFCGTAGDALREYEVVPARVADGDARSAVLCPDCHDKLRQVVEPFVSGSDATGGSSANQEVTFDSPVEFSSADDGLADGEADGDGDGDSGVDVDVVGADDAGEPTDPLDDAASDGRVTNGDADDEDDTPDGYYKVLRLLQNREFPVERSELTTVVTAAYDITEPQCDRILDAAVDRGVLVQDGSTLDLGRN